MQQYDHFSQGFNGTGGSPYNGKPTIPNIDAGEIVVPYLEYIAAQLFADMSARNTQVTNYLANQYGRNSFHNETFSLALQLASDYCEYLIAARQSDVQQAINSAVRLVNEVIAYNYLQQAPNMASITPPAEKSMYSNSASKMQAMKQTIKNYLKRGKAMYPNQPVYPNQPMQPSMGYPQQPMGYPNQGYPQQPQQPMNPQMQQHMQNQGSLLQRALSRGQPQQPQPMPYPNQPMGYPNQGYPQPVPNQSMQQLPPGFAYNQYGQVVSMNQMPVPQSMPMGTPLPQQPPMGYQPQPVNNMVNPRPTYVANPMQHQVPNNSQVGTPSQPLVPDFNPRAHLSQPGAQQPVTINTLPDYKSMQQPMQINSELAKYEEKVRQFAREKGLPWDTASIDMLEQIISQRYPMNGFIDPNNPYKVMSGQVTVAQGSIKPVSQQELDKMITKVTDDELKHMASKSTGQMVKDNSGNYVWQSEAGNKDSEYRVPSVINNTGGSNISGKEPPYPFAKMNGKGQWFIHEDNFYDVPRKKWGEYTQAFSCDVYREAFYILDDDGKMVDYFVQIKEDKVKEYEENIMKFEQHDDRRYFTPKLTSDLEVKGVDIQKVTEQFADAQVQIKVDELLRQIEEDGNFVTGDDVEISSTILLDDMVPGRTINDQYVDKAIAIVSSLSTEDGVKIDAAKCPIRFDDAYVTELSYDREKLKPLLDLADSTDYEDIVECFNELEEVEGMKPLVNELNGYATTYINNILFGVFGITRNEFYMESFTLDILDVVDEMVDLGHGKLFKQYAKKLIKSLLLPIELNSRQVASVYGEITEDDRMKFVIQRDVTVLPISSNQIVIPSRAKRAVVTETCHPTLYKLIDKTFEHVPARACEILFVTNDNRTMYVHRTLTEGVYAITQTSVIQDTVTK